jgi:hypothetical protein
MSKTHSVEQPMPPVTPAIPAEAIILEVFAKASKMSKYKVTSVRES